MSDNTLGDLRMRSSRIRNVLFVEVGDGVSDWMNKNKNGNGNGSGRRGEMRIEILHDGKLEKSAKMHMHTQVCEKWCIRFFEGMKRGK